jgi:signal transduction histidine kinase
MLALVIAVFGAMVCYLAWRSRLADLDGSLRARADTLSRALQPATAGTFDLTLPPEASTDSEADPYHVLWTPSGEIIDRSDPNLDVPMPAAPGARTRGGLREITVRTAPGAIVLAGQSVASLRAEILSLAAMMAAVGAAALGLSLFGGWWLVGRALAPIDRIGRTSRAMVDGDFAARIPIDRVETELEQLAHALNEAFDRLHVSLERQRRFTADASHELRTPLTTMSTEVQWALARERQPVDYRRALDACRRATARMQLIVERLLTLARADAMVNEVHRQHVRLDDLANDVVRDLGPLAEAKHVAIRVDAQPIEILGDAERLVDAVTNVVTNAIQYNVTSGRVHLTVRENADSVELVVEDTGVGISPADMPRVFEPFFRADAARSRDLGGAGLGLAVTRAIVRGHGGDVVCESAPGRGTTVTINFQRGASVQPAL